MSLPRGFSLAAILGTQQVGADDSNRAEDESGSHENVEYRRREGDGGRGEGDEEMHAVADDGADAAHVGVEEDRGLGDYGGSGFLRPLQIGSVDAFEREAGEMAERFAASMGEKGVALTDEELIAALIEFERERRRRHAEARAGIGERLEERRRHGDGKELEKRRQEENDAHGRLQVMLLGASLRADTAAAAAAVVFKGEEGATEIEASRGQNGTFDFEGDEDDDDDSHGVSEEKKAALRRLTASSGSSHGFPPLVLSASVTACLQQQLWSALQALIECGCVSASCHPSLTADLIERGQLLLVQKCLMHVADISADDLLLALHFVLDPSAVGAELQKQLVSDLRSSVQKNMNKAKHRMHHLIESGMGMSVDDIAARRHLVLQVCAVERFSPREQMLHAFVGVERDQAVVAALVAGLPGSHVRFLLRYLLTWLQICQQVGGDVGQAASAAAEPMASFVPVPLLSLLLLWASSVLDAHLLTLLLDPSSLPLAIALQQTVSDLVLQHKGFTSLAEVVNQLTNQRPIPVLNSLATAKYCVEVLDLT